MIRKLNFSLLVGVLVVGFFLLTSLCSIVQSADQIDIYSAQIQALNKRMADCENAIKVLASKSGSSASGSSGNFTLKATGESKLDLTSMGNLSGTGKFHWWEGCSFYTSNPLLQVSFKDAKESGKLTAPCTVCLKKMVDSAKK
jgi:hypothetical protein